MIKVGDNVTFIGPNGVRHIAIVREVLLGMARVEGDSYVGWRCINSGASVMDKMREAEARLDALLENPRRHMDSGYDKWRERVILALRELSVGGQRSVRPNGSGEWIRSTDYIEGDWLWHVAKAGACLAVLGMLLGAFMVGASL